MSVFVEYVHDKLGINGRLGNQLWQIASSIGLSELYNGDISFPQWSYAPYFSVPDEYFVDHPYGRDITELATHLPESERSYLQDYSLWSHIEKTIRSYFTPSALALDQIQQECEWYYPPPNAVALHIRRDERVTTFSKTHPMPPWEYYEKAMDIERERLGDPIFCVFSDDIPWCKENLKGDFLFVEGRPRYQDQFLRELEEGEDLSFRDHLDLFRMAMCDGHIIPNSTFGWWGAVLSDNPHPIYPGIWYGEELNHIDWRLQIPDGWVEVNW